MSCLNHGGNVTEYARSLHCKREDIIDLSSNINFVKPTIHIDFNTLDIASYPNYSAVSKLIAEHYSVTVNQIELFNGATSAISSLFRHLSPKRCIIFSPSYVEYKNTAQQQHHCECIFLPNDALLTDSDLSEIMRDDLVIAVNPSTPDGQYRSMEKLITICKDRQAILLIDESFLEFCDKPSAAVHINNSPQLYILKSMTKYFGSAGIRIGLIISDPANISQIASSEPLWKLSQFDISYISGALSDQRFHQRSKESNLMAKQALLTILKEAKSIDQIYPSDANFFLVRLKDMNASQFQQQLNPFKILIRDCANFIFLSDQYVRLAVKETNNLALLRQAVTES